MERVNLWLTILGIICWLSQPIVLVRDSEIRQPLLSYIIFQEETR